MRDMVVSVHLHDNHGEKDEHLPPYDGSVDWTAAIPLLKTVPFENLPIVLELKEKFGPDTPSAVEQLAAARASFDKFENEWNYAIGMTQNGRVTDKCKVRFSRHPEVEEILPDPLGPGSL